MTLVQLWFTNGSFAFEKYTHVCDRLLFQMNLKFSTDASFDVHSVVTTFVSWLRCTLLRFWRHCLCLFWCCELLHKWHSPIIFNNFSRQILKKNAEKDSEIKFSSQRHFMFATRSFIETVYCGTQPFFFIISNDWPSVCAGVFDR